MKNNYYSNIRDRDALESFFECITSCSINSEGVDCTTACYTKHLEPNNVDLKKYYEKVSSLRDSNKISLPSNIDLENKINPFLRTSVDQVKDNAENYAKKQNLQPVEVLAAIRDWKDNF